MKKIGILFAFVLVMALLPTFVPQPAVAMTGSGTPGDPYVIYNVTDLQNISLDTTAYYVLNNTIDASDTVTWNGGLGFAPIGGFSGNLNGHHYSITGLFINRSGTGILGGLFAAITGGTVQNISILDADITLTAASTSPATHGGILVGTLNGGLVQYVYTSGVITGIANDTYGGNGHSHDSIGGIIGVLDAGTLRYSGSDADATATGLGETLAMAGGLVGQLNAGGTIYDCYARGDVEATHVSYGAYAGGGLGYHTTGGTMDNCYATGDVVCNTIYHGGLLGRIAGGAPACTDSFWDVQTTGEATSACGTGKTTAEMKTQSTFTAVGWNFDTIWGIGGTINDGYPYLLWWYNPPTIIDDVNQVVWFQPNAIIVGTELPNRAQGGTLQDGEFHWGANPAGITISHGELVPEEEYDFAPITPSSEDIIKPAPEAMTTDVDTAGLVNNPLYPMVAALGALPGLNERLVWLGLAWLVVIASMLFVHIGFDTKKGTEKPQHFVLTTIVGLGLSIFFYVIGIFPLWVIILMALGLVGAIIWERQPVL